MHFYLHNHTTPEGRTIILRSADARIGKNFKYSTGIKIETHAWDAKNQRVKKGYDKSGINEELSMLEQTATTYLKNPSVTKDELVAILKAIRLDKTQIKPDDASMLEVWQQFLDRKGSTIKPSTWQSYTRSREVFEEFLTSRYKQLIPPKAFTYTLYMEWEDWLLSKFSDNTASRHMKRLSQIAKYAVKSGHKFGMDLDDISYSETPGRQIYIKTDQLKQLLDLNLGSRLDRIRDVMIVHCFTGVRISDLFRINKSIIHNGKLSILQQKTEKPILVPILEPVQKVLDKYNGSVPRYSEQQYRKGIKEVYEILDPDGMIEIRKNKKTIQVPIHKLISSHDMIRTFVRFLHDKGVSVAAIAKVTGKTVKILLKNYLADDTESALREVEKVKI
jgi:hypothetical protein